MLYSIIWGWLFVLFLRPLWYLPAEAVVLDILDYLIEALLELLEILLVQENLVFVKGETAVRIVVSLAFGDGQIEILPSLRSFYVKEVGPFAGTDWL